MELEFVLRYFAVRGRCEPIIMVLEDAGLPYSLEETTVEEWVNRKASGNVHPEDVPFGRLPTLEVYPRKDHRTAATKPQFVIGETGSILRFLDNYNSRRNRPDEPVNMDPLHQSNWYFDMLQDASLFYLIRIFQMTVSKDWLAQPQRDILLHKVAAPFLRSVEFHLAPDKLGAVDLDMPLRGSIAATFTALSFTFDVFPHLRTCDGAVDYARCGELFEAISTRNSIATWYSKQAIAKKPWTISDHGTHQWIMDEAQNYS